jgi:hypothetical protein
MEAMFTLKCGEPQIPLDVVPKKINPWLSSNSRVWGQITIQVFAFPIMNMSLFSTTFIEKNPFEKLLFTQLVMKFPAFYGTWMFITVLIRTHHWDPILSPFNPVHNLTPYFSS